MSAVVVETDADEARWSRAAAIAGLVWVVLFVASFFIGGETPDYDDPNREWVEWFDDSGHRASQVTAAFVAVAAALVFVMFLAGLVRRLRRLSPGEVLPTIVLGAGLVFVALSIASHITVAQVSAAITFSGGPDEYPIPSAGVLRQAEQLGIGLGLLGGGWAAAVFVFTASLMARGTAAFPPWLTIAGLVVGILLLLSVFFTPLVLLPLWVLAASIAMLVRPLGEVETTATPVG
jgi:hypothetical protein